MNLDFYVGSLEQCDLDSYVGRIPILSVAVAIPHSFPVLETHPVLSLSGVFSPWILFSVSSVIVAFPFVAPLILSIHFTNLIILSISILRNSFSLSGALSHFASPMSPTLTRQAGDSDSVGAFDAFTAIQINGFVITSPNADYIPEPPLGLRSLRLWNDCRFGADNYIQWPQPYNPTYSHFMAIRRPSDDDDDDGRYCLLWWTPTPINHVAKTDNVLTGLGRLSTEYHTQFVELKDHILERVRNYVATRGPNCFLRSLETCMRHSLLRLCEMPGTFAEIYLGVRDFQRYYLELLAFLDYQELYQPRMNSSTAPSSLIADNLVGESITSEVKIMGVDEHLRRPQDSLDLSLWRTELRFPVQFTGNADDPGLPRAIHNFSRTFCFYANPFDASRTDHLLGGANPKGSRPQSLAALQSAKRGKESGKATRAQPVSSGSSTGRKVKGPAGRDKFRDPDDSWIPPSIPAWATALANVEKSEVLPLVQGTQGSLFPDPTLFCTSTPFRRARYIAMWLRTRPVVVYCIAQSEARVSTDDWRLMLWGEWWSNSASLQVSESGVETRQQKRREGLQKIFGPCLDQAGVSVSTAASQQLLWQDQPILEGNEELDPCVAQGILWELFENNFRSDLRALDCLVLRGGWDGAVQEDMIQACFGGDGTLIVTSVPLANQGLAADDVYDQLPCLLALRSLMRDWPVEHPAGFSVVLIASLPRENSPADIHALEAAVAKCYAQTFWKYFRRAAIVPHCIPVS
ncbi:hypothetical protein JAAARDRAFT_200992 [Jaapia argillacea MUCL 33604]|uniref:Uncharacterized protein n=1 Tax=Jaapia argillacea MUCL 33604 TaxID=933084 RepID=A0A067P3C7_9AGAM|nr:hypothetical protein JAAARDRAFT_200992 [Jaapia argillacea MUCL 33604]